MIGQTCKLRRSEQNDQSLNLQEVLYSTVCLDRQARLKSFGPDLAARLMSYQIRPCVDPKLKELHESKERYKGVRWLAIGRKKPWRLLVEQTLKMYNFTLNSHICLQPDSSYACTGKFNYSAVAVSVFTVNVRMVFSSADY